MNGNINRDVICAGCLSDDRVLFGRNEAVKQVYFELLGANEKIDNSLKLCWECCALARKVIKFKQRITYAHRCMTNLISHSLSSLSNLKLSTNLHIECMKERTKQIHFVKVEDENDMLQDMSVNEMTINDVHTDIFHHNDKFDNDCNDSFAYDDIKPDIEESAGLKTVLDFNESDDEPLKIVKDKKTKKKTKRKEVKRAENPPGVVHSPRVLKKLQQLNVDPEQLEMLVLSWEEVISELESARNSDTFLKHAHKCHHCAIGFNHKCKLDEHMKKHDQSSGSAECEVCHIWCKDKQALSSHKRRHRVRWRCRVCQSRWSRASVAADHLHRRHAAPPPSHACACGHRETTLGALRRHTKSAHSQRLQCDECRKEFRDRAALRTHLFIHRGEKEYTCPKCDKQFLFKKAMEIHLITHEMSANLYCHECDVTFKNQMSYNQHLKYNLKHIDPALLKYACKLCDKKFAKAIRLKEHNMAVHLKITPIQCTTDGCSFACASRAVLRAHVRSAHAPREPLRQHVCHVCGLAYTSRKSLEGHLRAHSGSRPYCCALCPATFGYRAALYNHNKLVHRKGRDQSKLSNTS